MRKKSIHILLIDRNPADVRFIREALAELEEIQQGNSWLSPYELTDVECLEEAALLLSQTSFDVILADLRFEEAQGLESLRRLRALSRHVPIVLLLRREDPALAIRLMQEGVEDVLVKHEMDCSPLGRSLRAAIERQRIAIRLRSMTIRDELSGLLNFSGLVQFGEQFSHMAARAATAAHCVTFSLEHFENFAERVGRQEEEWLLLECTEVLRGSAQEGDLLAYLGEGLFVWLCLAQEEARIRASLAAQEAELAMKFLRRGHAISLRYRIGIALLDETVNWNLVNALELAEQQSWPTQHLPTTSILRSLALQ